METTSKQFVLSDMRHMPHTFLTILKNDKPTTDISINVYSEFNRVSTLTVVLVLFNVEICQTRHSQDNIINVASSTSSQGILAHHNSELTG